MGHLGLSTWSPTDCYGTIWGYNRSKPHIYRKLGHRIDGSRSHSYCHGYDEEVCLGRWSPVCQGLRVLGLCAIGGGGSEKCKARKHKQMLGMKDLVELLCIVGQVFGLSLCFGVWWCHCRNSSIFSLCGFLNLSEQLPGWKRSGETPCLTITKLSKPKPTVIQALSYLLAKTVGNHLASLESRSKNRTSCSLTSSSSWSKV